MKRNLGGLFGGELPTKSDIIVSFAAQLGYVIYEEVEHSMLRV
jgi:hypothetical protein